jgi:hypothetical protein
MPSFWEHTLESKWLRAREAKSRPKLKAATTGDLFRTDGALSEAMRDAEDILKWRIGPNVPGWRIARLAQAMVDARR